jgi:hypothetical protein
MSQPQILLKARNLASLPAAEEMKQNPVTYSLERSPENAEGYYRLVREFAEEVIGRATSVLGSAVAEFTRYLQTFSLEELRGKEEYLLELLSFGLLWNSYGGYALAVRWAPFVTLSRMAEWRKKHEHWKPSIDLARGILITLFLLPRRGARRPTERPTLRDVDRLCLWLEATGEFREQALRFIRWRAFWETMPEVRRAEFREALFTLTDWFVARSTDVLGAYTTNVPHFLQKARKRYRWREDRVQCMRSRAEYHLNMVGAEIMNRAFREDFDCAEAKAVLLPACMRARPADECEATRVREGLRCSGCLPACRVNQLREMGKRRGFEVFIIPHASDLSLWSPRRGRPHWGVVAAACVTTLVEGGWELKRYDVPAQCVLLNYSGCQKHWHAKGVATALNVRELKRRLSLS